VKPAAAVGDDDVAHAVAVDVGELRARLDRRAEIEREAGEEIGVAPVLLVRDVMTRRASPARSPPLA